MKFIKNMSIKASISILVVFTVIAFLGIILFGFNRISDEVESRLGDNQLIIQSLHDEMEQTITNNLAQVSEQVNSGFSIFLNKMREITETIEHDHILQALTNPEFAVNGPYEGTPYEILPAKNRYRINELLTPYFANLVGGIHEIQYAYIGTPDQAMYIGPLDDFDFTTFDPTSRPWYQDAVAKPQDHVWTDPYIDAITSQPIMTLAKAIMTPTEEGNSRLLGVIGLDFSLDTLAANVSTVKIGESGYAFLLDANGALMYHPEWHEQIGEVLDGYEFLDDVYGGDAGLLEYTLDGQEMIGYYVTNEITGWKLVITAPEEELLSVQKVINQVETHNESILTGLNDSERWIMLVFIGTGILIMMLGIWIAHMYSRGVSRRIYTVSTAMDKVSGGDLTQSITVSGDQNEISQLGRHFNEMVGDLKQLVQSNLSTSAQITEASQTLRDVSQRSSAGAANIQHIVDEISSFLGHQAQSARQTGEVLASFTEAMEQVMDAIEQVDRTVRHSHDVSLQGSSSIANLEEASNRNLDLAKTVTHNIEELSNQMSKVYEFTTVIQEIAASTNLLALNASIEATRAGDEGLGFAVVAQEVRKLAEQSARSAKDISDSIRHIQAYLEETVRNIRKTEQMAHQQHEVLALSKEGFDRIERAIDEIHSRMEGARRYIGEIRTKSDALVESMHHNIEEGDTAARYVVNIHHTLEEQFQAIKEVATSSDELSTITETLTRESRKFKTE